jgi:nitroreductase
MKAWYEAAQTRRSRRTYDTRPARTEQLETLSTSCDGFHPYDDARVTLVAEPGLDVFTGVIGSYGKVTGAPHVLVMIADSDSRFAQQHAGYVGEAAVLEATALGLGTCWVGGFFDKSKAAGLVHLAPGERIVAVSPVGTPVTADSASERTMLRMARSHTRKPLEKVAGTETASWPEWARAAVECARIAPSAINRQPWRFRLEDGALVVSQDSPLETPRVTKALDCGIAMLHAELGALSQGVAGRWHDVAEKADLARFTPLEVPT